jgi:hypothetical protein
MTSRPSGLGSLADFTDGEGDEIDDYAYHAAGNGNQTSRGGDTYTYDHENRLTQAVINGVTFSSTYNGDGLRMSHTENSVTTSYTWDVAAGLPVVIQDDDNTYVYGLDLISQTDEDGVQTYYFSDGLGCRTASARRQT